MIVRRSGSLLALALLLAAPAGCKKSASYLRVTVEAPGLPTIASLRGRATVNGATGDFDTSTLDAGAASLRFPLTFSIGPLPGPGPFTLSLDGRDSAGASVGAGSAGAIATDGVNDVTVTLRAPGGDGGLPDLAALADLSGDLAGAVDQAAPLDQSVPLQDLVVANDFAKVPDLSVVPDLINRPCKSVSGVYLCEDFEGTLAQWSVDAVRDVTISIDGVHSKRGNRALHYHAPVIPTTKYEQAVIKNAVVPLPFYIRVWMYIESPAPATIDTNLVFVSQETDPFYNIAGLNYYNSKLETGGSAAFSMYKNSLTLFPTDRWVCVEMQIDQRQPDAGVDVPLRVWTDYSGGTTLTEDPALRFNAPLMAAPPFAELYIGFDFTNSTPGFDWWMDEIIIDDKPIGCLK